VPLLAIAGGFGDRSGRWFQRDVPSHGLEPACLVSYRRRAFARICESSPLRLTLDRDVHGSLSDRWNFHAEGEGLPLLFGFVILLLKYRAALPAPFAGLMQDLGLASGTLSKYRLCRRAWGLPR
jgi:hypothetical protein